MRGTHRASKGRLTLRRSIIAVTIAVALSASASSAVAGPEWRPLDGSGGVGWGPCATITMHPNLLGQPGGVDLTADLQTAAAIINAAVGRQLLSVGGLTSAVMGLDDELFSVSFTDLGYSAGGGGKTGRGAPRWIVGENIVSADVVIDPTFAANVSREERLGTIMHEIGHALGLGHVADSHEVMAQQWIESADIGPGTTAALRTLYAAPCGSSPRLTEGPFPWALPEHEVDGTSYAARIGTDAGSVIDLGLAVAERVTDEANGAWAQLAVVCRDDVFADCLGGAALAGADGPVLFVPGGASGTLPAPVRSYLERNLAASAPVFVLGGPAAVSDAVVADLTGTWSGTKRVMGMSRIETAAAIAREVVARRGAASTAIIARADEPADAVTGGAAAGARGMPILLTDSTALHPETAAALRDLGVSRTLLLGGEAALSPAVADGLRGGGHQVERVSGRSRTETSVAVARHPELWGVQSFQQKSAFIGMNGYHAETWALALAAAPLAARAGAPILLTQHDGVPVNPPKDGSPGEPGWYLSHLRAAPGADAPVVTVFFVGAGRWADPHVPTSLQAYPFLD